MLFSFWQVMFILLVLLGFLLLQRHLKYRELANQMVSRFCSQHQLQLLDGSVALESMRWHWHRSGLIQRLSWRFEYTNGLPDQAYFDQAYFDQAGPVNRLPLDDPMPTRSVQRRAGLLVMLGGYTETFVLPDDPQFELLADSSMTV